MTVIPSESNRVSDGEAADTLSRQGPFRIVNIGGGQPVGLMSFVETMESALGTRIQKNYLGMQKGDVPRTYASPDLLRALTGFKPNTSVGEGVNHFLRWFRTYYQSRLSK